MSFDDAYRRAQAAQQQRPVPPPPPAPQPHLDELARRIDTEIVARFLRSKWTWRGWWAAWGDTGGNARQWCMGDITRPGNLTDGYLGDQSRGLRIMWNGDWYAFKAGGRYDHPGYAVRLLKQNGIVSSRSHGLPEFSEDDVYNSIQDIVAGFMTRNKIPLR